MKRAKFHFLLLGCILLAVPAAAADVKLSVAGSLTDAVKELVTDYQNSVADVRIQANFASSGSLAKQIVAGAPADIYISANPKWMQYLQEQGFIAADAARVLVHNSLVFVGRTTAEVQSLDDVTKLQRIALGSPTSVPAGRYAEQALVAAGIYPQLQTSRRLIFTKDVRQALLYADREEVDGSFVYRTDALLAKEAEILLSVPQALYPQVSYPTALTKTAMDNPAASSFYHYLFSSKSQQILQKYGFLIPE